MRSCVQKKEKTSVVDDITYVSERICEPVESVTVKRGAFNVKIDACADKTSRRTGNKENIRINRKILTCCHVSVSVWHYPLNQTFPCSRVWFTSS